MKKIIAPCVALLAFAGVANLAAAADVVGNAKAAENKIAMCVGCHAIGGYKSAFPEVYKVPMIGGQSEKYIESALKAYRGILRADPVASRPLEELLQKQSEGKLAEFVKAASKDCRPGTQTGM